MKLNKEITELMEASALEAVEHAHKYYEVTLDYSHESIKLVEDILTEIYSLIPHGIMRLFKKRPSDDNLWGIAEMYGGYIGQTYRKHFGGDWDVRDDVPLSDGPVITFSTLGGDSFFPVSKVWRRIKNGDDNNIKKYYSFLKQRAEGTIT